MRPALALVGVVCGLQLLVGGAYLWSHGEALEVLPLPVKLAAHLCAGATTFAGFWSLAWVAWRVWEERE